MNEKVSLCYKDGTSDKVYHAQLLEKEVGWVVEFQYGRRGSTLQTGTKIAGVAFDRAKKVYDKLVSEKRAKGYTEGESGTPYQGSELAGQMSGLMPQLLNAIPVTILNTLLEDPDWIMQEKKDGVRLMIRKEGHQIIGSNRKGLVVPVSTAIVNRLLAYMHNFVVDGECIGDVFWMFDMLERDGNDYRHNGAESRHFTMMACFGPLSTAGSAVRVVPAYSSWDAKAAELAVLMDAKAEGVVFKRRGSPYVSGRPASGGNQLKFKFTQTCTCRVVRLNEGKRSVQLMVRNGKGFAEVGNVTIPVNHELPAVSDLVEVRYLYAYPGGSLFQPVYLGRRDDLDDADDVSSLKFKQGTTGDEDNEDS